MSLASEECQERDANLLGHGFLEKASKRLEVGKTLNKVINPGKSGQPVKRMRYDTDSESKDSFIQGRFGSLRQHEESPLPTSVIVQQVQEQEVYFQLTRSFFPGTPARSQVPRTSPTINSNGPSGIRTGQHLSSLV